jgi:hypothetical protein
VGKMAGEGRSRVSVSETERIAGGPNLNRGLRAGGKTAGAAASAPTTFALGERPLDEAADPLGAGVPGA